MIYAGFLGGAGFWNVCNIFYADGLKEPLILFYHAKELIPIQKFKVQFQLWWRSLSLLQRRCFTSMRLAKFI